MSDPILPSVAMWRIHALRVLYVLVVAVMGLAVWQQVIFVSADWPMWKVTGKSILAALALLCVLGVRYPLAMLPLLLLETIWKTVALLLVVLPAWLGDRMTAELEQLFADCIGIIKAYLVMPWPHVWARYIVHPTEPWTPDQFLILLQSYVSCSDQRDVPNFPLPREDYGV